MLAYVFWHWRADSLSAEHYEQMTREFHSSLAQRRPPGFLRSAAFAIPPAGWIPETRGAVEDWYLIENSAALDGLDRDAVSPPHQQPHDAIAASVAGGAGGLYRLRAGELREAEVRSASWFPKPKGMSYPTFFRLLEPLTTDGRAALWGRQMVLGPAPEFCLQSSAPLDVPAPSAAVSLALRPVWP